MLNFIRYVISKQNFIINGKTIKNLRTYFCDNLNYVLSLRILWMLSHSLIYFYLKFVLLNVM